ncbi:MAG TPA: TonB-dependent receptor [Puia sp.]|nr:TonB-dependent receptor [Puia sp.]
MTLLMPVLANAQRPARDTTGLPGIDTLGEIVVTGVSRATLARKNPVAITRVSSLAINRASEPNIIDALVKNVPGLNAVKTGPNISKPFIRGLGYNRVLTLYDGIRQEGQQWGDEHGIEVDAYAIDKAEVIKGPASLLYGSDAVAGVVSLYPYVPAEKDGRLHGRLLSEYQSNNGLIGNGVRLSSSHSHWLWVIRGSWRLAENYTNKIDGRVYNTGFAEKNLSVMTGTISAAGATYLNATLYDNLQGIPDGSRDSLTRKFTRQVYEGSRDTITNRPIVPEDVLNSYTLSPLHQHIQHYRLYANNHYRIGRGEIDAVLGFQQNIRREYSHPTEPGQAGLYVRLNTVNYGVRYILPEFSSIEFTVGVNGMAQNNKSKQATDFPIPDYQLADLGGYLHGKWAYGKLIISGGVRYDSRVVDTKALYTGTDPSTGFGRQVTGPDTAGAKLQFPVLHRLFTGVSLSAGAAWQLTENLSVKLNIARGYRGPNITELASNGLDPGAHIIYLGNRDFVPEFSWQQDLGISGDFHSITASLSVFNNNVQHYIYLEQLTDAQGQPLTDAQGNKTFQYQQASAQLYGAEGLLAIHPPGWKGFSFTNTVALVYGLNKKSEYRHKGNAGEYLPFIPPARWLSSLSQEWATPSGIFSSFRAGAELEYNARQDRFLALYHTETPTPAYTLLNLSAAATVRTGPHHSIQLMVQVNNLLDRVYQNNLSRLKYFEYYTLSPNGHLGMYNMGRNVCIKTICPF